MGVTTQCPGEIAKIDAEVKGTYAVGAVLGYIEASEADAARLVKHVAEPPKDEVAQEVPGRDSEGDTAVKTQNGSGSHFQVDEADVMSMSVGSGVRSDQPGGLPVPASAKGAGFLSPRVRARMAELQLTQADLASIAGTGTAGRVTIKDLETFLSGIEGQLAEKPSAIRTGVADAMRRSWMRPLATVGMPVHIDALLDHRKTSNPKPGPALYILRALAIALGEHSATAGRLVAIAAEPCHQCLLPM
jgi:pyruvate/2-oxoglutarate dehydrogenase complex dihydrolipoamide acyltransferase (E2) component